MPKHTFDFIPLLHQEDDFWVLRDLSLSALVRVRPWSGEGRSVEQFTKAASIISNLFENELFANSTISICLVVQPGPEPNLVRNIEQVHRPSQMIDGRIGILSGTVHRDMFIGINVPTIEKKETGKEFERKFGAAKDRMDRIIEVLPPFLETVFEEAKVLDGGQAFDAWNSILNHRAVAPLQIPEVVEGKLRLPPPPAEQLVTSDIQDQEGYIYYSGERHRAYSCNLPSIASAAKIFEAVMKATYPSRICLNFHIPGSQHEKKRQLASERSLSRFMGLGKSREHNLDKAAAIDALLKEMREQNAKPIDFSGFIIVSGQNGKLDERADRTISALAEVELETLQELVYATNCYFCWGVPGLGGNRIPESRRFVCSSKAASHLLPLYGDFRGDDKPTMLFSNRYNSLVGFSLLSEKQAKWGAMVVAPSGSGKTFLANNILTHLVNLYEPPFVGIIDMALVPSYSSLVPLFGGVTIALETDGNHAINPFEFVFPLTTPPERQIAFLRENFLPSMLENVSKIQLQFLERSIRRMYQNVVGEAAENPKAIETSENIPEQLWRFHTWFEARQAFIEKYKQSGDRRDLGIAMHAHSQSMPTIYDLLETLVDPNNAMTKADQETAEQLRRQLTAAFSGTRAKLFGHNTSTTMTNLNEGLVYFYFGDIVNFPDLLSTAFLAVHHYLREKAIIFNDDEAKIFADVYGQDKVLQMRSRKKVFLLDEVHNLGKSSESMHEIELNYRQGRTLGLSTVCITQGMREITENNAGKAMVTNAALMILLRHSTPEAPNEIAVSYVADTLGLTPKMRSMLANLRRTDDYSEMIIISEGIGVGVVQYMPTAIERWFGTTHNLETGLRNDLVRELISHGMLARESLLKVVTVLADKYPKGIARLRQDVSVVKDELLAEIS